MKVDRYAVSVQWGAGMHYFISHHPTELLARQAAWDHQRKLARRKPVRGAKPAVHVWRREVS